MRSPATDSIILTGGDPAGIGPEIINKSVSAWERLADRPPIVYFSTADSNHQQAIADAATKIGYHARFVSRTTVLHDIASLALVTGQLLIVPPEPLDSNTESNIDSIVAGRPSVVGGRLAFEALDAAVTLALRHGCRGLVTAPLAKDWIARSGVRTDFHGHTDYLAERCGADSVLMLMHGNHFSVIPLTVHIALRDVSNRLRTTLDQPGVMDCLRRIARLPSYAPPHRWALAALNPHAGESGLMGSEENDFLEEFVERLQKQNFLVDGPIPADALFIEANRKKYRLMICCYHDQALIPFKALEGNAGINCTIGLPFARTSPDHGTAFDIAGQDRADPTSMIASIVTIGSANLREEDSNRYGH
ncbi:MAG: 4-hydroxythreonine-4-phosphate dehydrogenase PdxA [Leptospiraceae bacterium]|nr:4-hydroxythreonine-4-phosphate dehydrogenase PdxA [Leptospiraceae bacterium]